MKTQTKTVVRLVITAGILLISSALTTMAEA